MLHSTAALIDFEALAYNLTNIRKSVGEKSILAAVKANAYGHGAIPLTLFLEKNHLADAFGVATVREGIELRTAGVTLPILKFSQCFPDELAAAIDAQLTLTVSDAENIACANQAAAAAKTVTNVHLAVDTGMRRIGCQPEQAVGLAEQIAAADHLVHEGIFTHFPCSDTNAGIDFTKKQHDQLQAVARAITTMRVARGLTGLAEVHASNSGGILGHSLDGLTMVRPGIMMYGCYPDVETPHTIDIRPVLSLVSRVSFIKRISQGETVGYGRTWTAPSDRWIATIPIGYADGYSRLNSNRGRVLIAGRSYPVAGRVCMDQTMVDLGPDEPSVTVGDEVILIGKSGSESITTDELASLMGTISHEVTCLLTPRVPRVPLNAEAVDDGK